MKRLVSYALILLLLAGIFSSNNLNVSAVKGDNIYSGNKDSYMLLDNITLPDGIANKNIKGLHLNVEIFFDKGIAVYGNPESVINNDVKYATELIDGTIATNEGYYLFDNGSKGEYRYHGYTYDGNLYTNQDFPPDAVSSTGLETKKWVHHSWDFRSDERRSIWNDTAISATGDPFDRQQTREWINKSLSFADEGRLLSGVHGDGSEVGESEGENDPKAVYNFLNIHSPSTSYSAGEGKMWHIKNNKWWYQTFSTLRRSKKQPNVECIVTVINSGNNLIPAGEDSTTVRVQVTGIFKDEDYHDDEVQKAIYYTRKDIKSFELTLNGISKKADKSEENQYSAYFDIEVKRSDLDEYKRIFFNGEAQALYYDNNKSNVGKGSAFETLGVMTGLESLFLINPSIDAEEFSVDSFGYIDASIGNIVSYDYEVKELDTGIVEIFSNVSANSSFVNQKLYDFTKDRAESLENYELATYSLKQTVKGNTGKTSTSEKLFSIHISSEVTIVEPDLHLPDKVFDVIGYNALDNTDLTDCKDKYVMVNNDIVDYDYFFSGNFTFGKITSNNNSELHKVSVYYISTDDVESFVERWVYVYNTTPKVQIDLGGTTKENRKITFQNTSEAANDPYLLQHYPISYTWEFEAVDGSMEDFKIKQVGQGYNSLVKKEGQYRVTLRGQNSLGYSDTYDLPFIVQKDHAPAMILNIWNNVLARTETLNITQDYVSVDGDNIIIKELKLYYDENQDGVSEKELLTIDADNFTGFSPDKLGKYTVEVYVEESFGEETISEFLDGSETVSKTIQRDFFVDNLRPLTEVYLDIPMNFPRVDLMIMRDEKLGQGKNDEMVSNRINYDNELRNYGINPLVRVWDLKTYRYSQDVTTSRNTGRSYPSSSITYNSGGYSGTLSRYSVRNDWYWVDYGYWDSRRECHTEPIYELRPVCLRDPTLDCVYMERVQTGTKEVCEWNDYWVSDMRRRNDYTGYYRGTVYKNVKQEYESFWDGTSDKYIVYVSYDIMSNKSDLDMVLGSVDAKVILVGSDNIKSQVSSYDYFVLNDGRNINTLIDIALDNIADENPFMAQYLITTGTDVNINSVDLESEGDGLSEYGFQYVHNPNFFDNSQGLESFAAASYSDSNWTSFIASRFNKPGYYEIYRKVRDVLPPPFDSFELESNTSKITLIVHREPIADCTLDWDYDAVERVYKTTWVDKSYDPDYQYSRTDKGIKERKIMYRKTGEEWKYMIPDNLSPGTYQMEYYVKDIQGAWSEPHIMNFTLNTSPSIQLEASLRALDDKFTVDNIPASEYLELYNVWSRYPYSHKLEIVLYDGSTRVSPVKTIDYYTGTKIDNDINWDNITYQIPETLEDGNYTLKLTAVDTSSGAINKEINFNVDLSTPVDLDISLVPDELTSDETSIIQVQTSKYVDEVEITLYEQTEHEITDYMTLKATGDIKVWEYQYHISGGIIPEGDYTAKFIASTPNNNTETKIKGYKHLDLKLENLRIVAVYDYGWQYKFEKTNREPTDLQLQGIRTKDFPLLHNDKLKDIKLGYSVDFKIDSTGLNHEEDTIDITVHYYAFDKYGKYQSVDIYIPDEKYENYYKLEDSEYVDTSKRFTLTRDNKTVYESDPDNLSKNTWRFRMFLPPTAKAVKKGEPLDLYSDNTFKRRLLVLLEIEAKKHTGKVYDYTLKETDWGTDDGDIYGVNKPSGLNLLGKGINHGEVFYYHLENTLLDDIKIQREW